MYCWFLISILLIVFKTVKTEEVFTFSSGIKELKMCIKDFLSKDSDLDIGEAANDVAELVAIKFSHRSFTTLQLYKATNALYYRIRDKKYNLFRDNQVPKQLRTALKKALENCIARYNLPRFANEPQDLANLLDFILVDWPTPVNVMILTHEGRSILRLYAYSAGMRLMSALRYFSMDFDRFHRELLRIWMHRAQQYFDAQNDEIPYIRHRYTTDRERIYSSIPLADIHTIDDVNSFTSRKSKNLFHRNQAIYNFFEVGPSYQRNESSSESFSSRFSRAEYYLEAHIDQCYRIILFILELQIRGINTNEDDVYNEFISFKVMPFSIQKIIWSDEAYVNYLTLRKSFPSEDFRGCFFGGISTVEELIMHLSMSISSSNTLSTTTTSTTTTTTTSTEFPNFEGGSKKGGARTEDCGKYFLPNKRFKTIFSQPDQEPGPTNQNVYRYGYIAYKYDSKILKK